MADNSFRNQRRDALGRGGAAAQRDSVSDDPLAELARLIGQSDPQSPGGRLAAPPPAAVDDTAPPALDWSALGEDHGQQGQDVQQHYPASQPAAYQPYPAVDASWRHDAGGNDQPGARPYSPPAALFDDALAAARRQSDGYGDELGSAVPHSPTLPYIPPAHDGGASDEETHYQAHGSSYADAEGADGYQGEAAAGRRRGAVAIVAVLGLVVLGTAGALGYHAMFGGSVIPSLPPIIKPGDTPVKIVPKKTASAGVSTQADADAKAGGDQLVSREEKPVAVQPVDSMPRVVTTIPVMSNAADESPLPGATPPTGTPQAFNAPAGPSASPGSPAAPPAMSGSSAPIPFDQFSGPASAPSSGSKPVHTVIIKPAQSRPANRSAAAAAPPSARAERVRPPSSQAAREPRSRMASAAPLSIVPTQAGGALPPPARTRTAMAHASTPTSSGPMSLSTRQGGATQGMDRGYAVQVSSQHSESEARAAFRALQARFPQQLGHRQGWVRRANLGTKGVYYRVLVGPFASTQEASSLCGSLKAAGTSCLVQRN